TVNRLHVQGVLVSMSLSNPINVLSGRKVTLGLLLLMAFAGVRHVEAQATGSISGTVTDTSGAAIADAAVHVKNLGTGITQSVSSDAQGRYRAPDLAIGSYELQANKAGFQTVIRTGVALTVGAQPVVDFNLPVGQSQQTVTVQAEVSQVETQSTAVGALV